MRLINTSTYSLDEFIDSRRAPPYAILSHCWSQDPNNQEINYQDFVGTTYDSHGYGWQKISRLCSLAKSRGLDWAWIDTCCIDKTSSAELSEAINSMFSWYSRARECYVFLDDVRSAVMPQMQGLDRLNQRWTEDLSNDDRNVVCMFMRSRWFTRGWTLQELLAPKTVLFYNNMTEFIGTRADLAPYIALATRIPVGILTGKEGIEDTSIAQRICWASSRETTRLEDVAYSMLGLFDVNMPLLYGEGEKAFFRLQQEIMRQSDDQSIFAWGLHDRQSSYSGVLASSPQDFSDCQDIVRTPWSSRSKSFELFPGDSPAYMSTNLGVAIYHDHARPGLVGTLLGYRKPSEDQYTQVKLLLNCQEAKLARDQKSAALNIYLILQSNGQLWYRSGLLLSRTKLDKYMLRIQAVRAPETLIYAALRGLPDCDHDVSGHTQEGYDRLSDEEDVATQYQMTLDVPLSPLVTTAIMVANVVFTLLLATAVMAVIDLLPSSSSLLISAVVYSLWAYASGGFTDHKWAGTSLWFLCIGFSSKAILN